MKMENLKKELVKLENDFKDLGNELQELSPFATPGKTFNEYKSEEFYQTKREYEKVRKEISKKYDMIRELEISKNKQSNDFINSFGEATQRYITSLTYEKYKKRISKEIMNYIR